MRKSAIIAMVSAGSSLALYAGISQPVVKVENAQSECCDKSECCPSGGTEDCCAYSCE